MSPLSQIDSGRRAMRQPGCAHAPCIGHHRMAPSNGPPRQRDDVALAFVTMLAAAVAATLLPHGARAAEPAGATDVDRELTPVVVTATRTPSRIDRTIADTIVIDRAQIERATGRSVGELLARQPGVQIWSNGGACQTTSVSLRGLDARHVLLLIDGVRHGSATLGVPVWQNLSLDAIESIEIVQGPLSALYGSDAVGGVIQIFTRAGRAGLHADADLVVGTQSSKEAGAGLQFGGDRIDGAVRVTGQSTRAPSTTSPSAPFGVWNDDGDGCHRRGATARLGWNVAGDWRIDANAMDTAGMTRFDDGPGADAQARLDARTFGLQASGTVSGSWRTTLRYGQSDDGFDTRASADPFATLGRTWTRQRQWTWEHTVQTPVGRALLLADSLRQSVGQPGTDYDVNARTIRGVAAGLDGQSGPHAWQGALRRDDNSQFGGRTTWSAGYGHDLDRTWRATASYGTSFVAPSFSQLYYPGFGNPTLQPETGRTAEVALRWKDAGRQVRVAYFQSRIRGYISSGPQPQNIPRSRIDGVTASWNERAGDWLLDVSGEHISPRQVTETGGDTWLPRRARNTLRVSADRDSGRWRYGGSVVAFGGRYDDAANTQRLGGGATMDLRAEWQMDSQWRVGFALNDLFDRRIETSAGYPTSGRRAFVSLRWRSS